MEKINYQLKLEEIIKSLDSTPRLLLHACCGPCSSYCIEYLSNYFEITILYYNPNIYPETEYSRRLNELINFIPKREYKNKVTVIEDTYNPKEYYDSVKGLELLGEKSKRCYECYKLRLDRAAKYAKEHNYDYFTTTLSISPYKVSDWINEIGEKLEKEYNVKYLYSDFKKNNGYKRSQELSREYNMYRQDYCGCSFSLKETNDYRKECLAMDELFNNITKLYKLGDITGKPVKLTGGITNKVYKLSTNLGTYIIKILSKDTIDYIEKSENIASIAKDNGVNALGAIKLDKYVNRVGENNVLVYPFYNGVVHLTKELTLEHVRLLANSLAKLHSIKVNENITINKYEKNNYKELYDISLNINDSRLDSFKNNIDKLIKVYDEVYSSYLKLSNQLSYVHKDFNRKNVLWNDMDFRIIDWETATIDNPSIDFFNSAWFLTNDIEEEKFKVFISEYFSIMKLDDDFEISAKASIIEECNWLAYSLKRAFKLITEDEYEVNLGFDSIESSLTEIINYYDKIDLMLKYLKENK